MRSEVEVIKAARMYAAIISDVNRTLNALPDLLPETRAGLEAQVAQARYSLDLLNWVLGTDNGIINEDGDM